ncbi:MAG TPA: hypothetical protein PK231_05765 [Acidocella sp.]|nr:hypothetical protein [Acidocella sp.]
MIIKGARQGDVLIVPAENLPDTAHPVKDENGRHILAHGEATGHHHSFKAGPQVAMFRETGKGSGVYVKLDAPAPLEHQEHTALTFSPGVKRVIRQRVFSSGMARRLAD